MKIKLVFYALVVAVSNVSEGWRKVLRSVLKA